MNSDLLSGKSAIITGATRGIGKAISLALAKEGVRLGLMARNTSDLKATAELAAKEGIEVFVQSCDLAQPKQIPDVVHSLLNELKQVDFLVNNAGAFLDRPLEQITDEQLDHVLKVNLTAPFILCRELLPHMRSRRTGKIIQIASNAALQGYAGQSAYCASKHALLGLGRALALEAKPDRIQVHTLCPGGVDTDLIKGTALADRLQGQPMIQSDDIAQIVVFLLKQPGNIDIPEINIRRFVAS